MNVFDTFFKQFAYKFPKGYPDMSNASDVALLEHLISETLDTTFSFSILHEELLVEEVTDRQVSANTAKAVAHFIANAPEEYGFKAQSDKKRIGNPNKVDSDTIQQLFQKILGVGEIVIFPPRTGPNPSGKFDMYGMEAKDFGPIRPIVSGGGNAGEQYEQEFVSKAKAGAGKPIDEQPLDLQTLYSALNIDPTKLTANKISFTGANDTKRSLDLEGPKLIGKTISDMDIQYGNDVYHISLKNKAGSGLYSGKNIPFIKQDESGKIIYDKSAGASPAIEMLFDMFNVDKQRLADGINDYVNQTGEADDWSSTEIDTDKFKKLLASSFGYGYYYVREAGKGNVKVIPILTAEDAMDAVGNITSTEVKYPGPNTKQLGIKVIADSPLFGQSRYDVAVRNTSGKILPLSLRISKTR